MAKIAVKQDAERDEKKSRGSKVFRYDGSFMVYLVAGASLENVPRKIRRYPKTEHGSRKAVLVENGFFTAVDGTIQFVIGKVSFSWGKRWIVRIVDLSGTIRWRNTGTFEQAEEE